MTRYCVSRSLHGAYYPTRESAVRFDRQHFANVRVEQRAGGFDVYVVLARLSCQT
jgi:hypothetical protein